MGSLEHIFAVGTAHLKKAPLFVGNSTDDDDIHLFPLPSLNLTLHCLHVKTKRSRIRSDVLGEQQYFHSSDTVHTLCTWQRK